MSEENLPGLVKASPLGTIAIDLEGIITFWNKAAEEITGWLEDKGYGRAIKVLSEKGGEAYEEIRRRTLQGEVFTSLPVSAKVKIQLSTKLGPIKLLQSGRMEKFNATSKQPRYTGKEKILMNVDKNFCLRNEKWVVLLLLLEKFFGCVREATEVPPITKPGSILL